MSASVPYVVTVVVQGTREVIIYAVTKAEAAEAAEEMDGVIGVFSVELQE